MSNLDVKRAYAVLELDRKIIGVKLIHTKEDFDFYEAKEIKYPLAYCVAVKLAMNGLSLKMTKETSGCGGSTRALGLAPCSDGYFSGAEGCNLGLYQSREVASKVARQVKVCDPNTYGVIIKPLELFEHEPDVVIMVSNSYQIMRIIQGYSYIFGMQPNFNLMGNQAICVECTSYPYLTNQMNISLFCSGTRFLAKWKDTEVAAGMPYGIFEKVIEGVRGTINAVEKDDAKITKLSKLKMLGDDGSDIVLGYTYYLKLEQDKQKKRKKESTSELYE